MAKSKRTDADSFQGLFLGEQPVAANHKENGEINGEAKPVSETTQPAKVESKPKKKGRPRVNRETKKRITFTILQSQYEQASKIAYIDGKSVSEVIGDFLSDYIKKNRDKIAEYDDLKVEE